MKETTNYKLKKIDLTDAPPDITVLNPNFDSIDTKLKEAETHKNDSVAHVTASDKNYWGGKAAGNHNHDSAYAPKNHSDNSSIHVTTAEKNTWNGKADGSHGHTLASLGAAPSGYGVGEHVYNNRISNPLDLSLKTGIYGFTTYQGTVYNSPLPNMLGHIEVYAVGNEWHYVRAVAHDSSLAFINRYNGNDERWAGWKMESLLTWGAEWISDGTLSAERTRTIILPFSPPVVLLDTSITTGTNGVQNKSGIYHQGEMGRFLVQTASGYVKFSSLSGNQLTIKYKTSEGFGFKYVSLGM